MFFQCQQTLFLLAVSLLLWNDLTSIEVSAQRKKPVKRGQKKYLSQDKYLKHKELIDLAKKLEYDANLKEGENSLDFGLSPIDLNLLQDEEFATDVLDGVEEEFFVIDQEFGETDKDNNRTAPTKVAISLMHQGMYSPASEYNAMIDGLVQNVKRDIERREMDPLFFGIHNRGVIRHASRGETPLQPSKLSKGGNGNDTSEMPIGVGVIKGLKNLKRFGNAESRKDGDVTLVRTHYFFGPLDIDLIFGSRRGIRILNSTLSSLAAHALFEISDWKNTTTLKEFMTDSPMAYEVQLRGSRNRRFRNLSQKSILRVFKRGGRMETRLKRSFTRGLQRPIRDITQKRNKNKQNNKKKGKGQSRKPEAVSLHSFIEPYPIPVL